MKYRVTVDTGGTFTDVVVSDENGAFTIAKALHNSGTYFFRHARRNRGRRRRA